MADDPSKKTDPSNPSSDHKAMADYWDMVEAILGGAPALRAGKEKYLPMFAAEKIDDVLLNTSADYERRRQNAPLTNIYADISRNLAAKPFSKELMLAEDAPDDFKALVENIDGNGNNLHVFARETFQAGIDKAVDWILIEFPKARPVIAGAPLSKADEAAQNLRPYWVRIPAERMLAVYSAFVGGSEVIVHARIYEPTVKRTEFIETMVERVRVLNRELSLDEFGNVVGLSAATFEVFEKQVTTNGQPKWSLIEGPLPISIGVIPLVPFITGRRKGAGWQIEPPLRDIAYLQIEEFQQESNLKSVLEQTCFPMLAGNGVTLPTDTKGQKLRVPVGPKAVLTTPPSATGSHGEWKFIEPAAESIQKLIDHLEATQRSMRDLGLQPLMPKTGNLTATATAVSAAKAHSAVQSWALALKDAIEQALKFTAMWLRQDVEPEVIVHTDFGADFENKTDLDTLMKMRATGDLSRSTLWIETKRRGLLSDEFDSAKEDEAIKKDPQPNQGATPKVTDQVRV